MQIFLVKKSYDHFTEAWFVIQKSSADRSCHRYKVQSTEVDIRSTEVAIESVKIDLSTLIKDPTI